MGRWGGWSDRQKAVVLVVVLVLLGATGVGVWLFESRGGSSQGGEPGSGSSSVEAVGPVGGGAEESGEPSESAGAEGSGGTESSGPGAESEASESEASGSDSGSDSGSGEGSEGMSQEESAKEALRSVVPQWASLEYGAIGVDETAWLKSWRDDPAVGAGLVSQSRGAFVELFGGIMRLNVDAKVDTLKEVEEVSQEGNLSSWHVEMERHLTSVDESGAVDETETVAWTFTVEQDSNGSSQVTGYEAADPE